MTILVFADDTYPPRDSAWALLAVAFCIGPLFARKVPTRQTLVIMAAGLLTLFVLVFGHWFGVLYFPAILMLVVAVFVSGLERSRKTDSLGQENLTEGWYLLFVNDERTLKLFRRLPALRGYICAQDVQDNLFVVFNSSGQEYALSVDPKWNIDIEATDHNADKLRDLILEFYQDELTAIDRNSPLPELIEKLEKVCELDER